MDADKIKAVIGTNAWGSQLYEKALRGRAVSEDTLKAAVEKAVELGIPVFDTAQDYGLGKCQPMLGRLCGANTLISAKYTPMSGKYKAGQVRQSLEKDLTELNRSYVDIYWLHLPNAVSENIAEMIELYREGKIRNIGVSNFNLEECRAAKVQLDAAGIPLYGVQNHYSLLNRDWEKDGLVAWCAENGVAFWAWAVLEEGILAGPVWHRAKGWTFMKALYSAKRRRLMRLFVQMKKTGAKHGLTIAQVAMAYVASKGIVPVCGCRKPGQVSALYKAANTPLAADEVARLEQAADELGVRVFGKDIFRFAVKK